MPHLPKNICFTFR